MAEEIEAELGHAVALISEGAPATMTNDRQEMRDLAERVGHSAEGAGPAAGQALANAQTVASAAEQLAASIREISGQVSQSTAVVGRAVDRRQRDARRRSRR